MSGLIPIQYRLNTLACLVGTIVDRVSHLLFEYILCHSLKWTLFKCLLLTIATRSCWIHLISQLLLLIFWWSLNLHLHFLCQALLLTQKRSRFRIYALRIVTIIINRHSFWINFKFLSRRCRWGYTHFFKLMIIWALWCYWICYTTTRSKSFWLFYWLLHLILLLLHLFELLRLRYEMTYCLSFLLGRRI